MYCIAVPLCYYNNVNNRFPNYEYITPRGHSRGLLPRSPRRVQNRLSIHDSRPDRRTRL